MSVSAFLYLALAYGLGSIPFGLILVRLFGYGDIRSIGSGNIGATNVLRTGNRFLAILTLVLDMIKGAAAVMIAFPSNSIPVIFASALAVILGHMYPVWLRFKGGKGVATGFGALFALAGPSFGLILAGVWLITALLFRFSSLAALVSFAAAPAMAEFWLKDEKLALLCGAVAALVFWKHRPNIRRLLKNEEPKIRLGKKE